MKLIAAVASMVVPLVAVAQDQLRSPKSLCNALVQVGLPTPGWKPSTAGSGEWSCTSRLEPFGTSVGGAMPGNIAFYVRSKAFDRADEIRIKINVNNPADIELGFAKLRDATVALFKALAAPAPDALTSALAQRKPGVFAAPFGQAGLELQPGRTDSYVVILKSSEILAAKTAALQAGTGGFSNCKRVVAKAAGYPETELSGDGVPSLEAGYKSFMLKGRGRDLFFCEVHSGGKYKIKAALGGVFPFRYISEGTF